MKKIIVFAGTTEGRKLSECLAASGIPHTICVATEYGKIVLQDHPLVKVHRGRMDEGKIREYLSQGNFKVVVDATHPYARKVTENIQAAVKDSDITYLRLKRQLGAEQEDHVVYFDTNEECAQALTQVRGNILLTTGSKELSIYCARQEVRNRLFVRVLPGMESLSACMEQGIMGKQILAIQGPFSTELNAALIRQYGISCLVTKQSGASGGYFEKIEAAKETGIRVFAIGQPDEEIGDPFAEVCRKLEQICKKNIRLQNDIQITLVGVGMGDYGSLTQEVRTAVEESDILLGAERMIAPYTPRLEKKPLYLAKDIVPYLLQIQKEHPMEQVKVVVLFSGDSGFFSGCQAVYRALREAEQAGKLTGTIRILPGISSVACLAALTGESYHDAAILSMHGKKLQNLAERIRFSSRTFLLVSGVEDLHVLGTSLIKAGLTECTVVAGYQLSYPEQEIMRLTPQDCCILKKEGLYTCLILNPDADSRLLTHGKKDGVFIRGQVPMTKEEVREVSICKLKLVQDAIVYDIGSGTGSVAMEIAGLSPSVQVYAIEQKEEACTLIRENREQFGLENITVRCQKAPEGLRDLPAATHAFIGGSGGNLEAILQTLYTINPTMRVVITAVSMETISELRTLPDKFSLTEPDMVQLQVSRSKEVGTYHLMQAENPVWICAFQFQQQDGAKEG